MSSRHLAVSIATLLVACGSASKSPTLTPQSAPEAHARTIPFRIIDEDQIGRPVVDFVAGELRITPSGGQAIITERLIRGGINERPERIVAGFAYGDHSSNDWHERRKGRGTPLGRVSASAADTIRDTLVVELPRSSDLRLSEHWFYFQIQGEIRMPGSDRWQYAFRSIHSRPDIFVER